MRITKLGIELRTIGTTEKLYEDVDMILEQSQIPAGSVSGDVQTSTIAHSLQKMLSSEDRFSICAIRECAKIAQIVIPQERLDIYHPLHCMSWSEMLPEFRKQIVAMVLDDFRSILNPKSEEQPTIEI